MLPSEAMLQRDEERRALRAYLAGDQLAPLVMQRNAHYCIKQVLFPSRRAHAGAIWRFLMVWLGGIMPFCPAKAFFYRRAGVRIGRDVCLSPGVVIDPLFPSLIELEDGCCLGMGCRLLTHEYTATYFRMGPIHVCRGAVVGAYATVRGGVTVGAGATIGANSFVNRDVPPGIMVGGVPARRLPEREDG